MIKHLLLVLINIYISYNLLGDKYMHNLISLYINKLSLNDVFNFASKNNITLNNEEAIFILDFIKKNWQEALANPDSLKIDQYKSRFSEENFNKIKKLIIFYRNKYAKYLI